MPNPFINIEPASFDVGKGSPNPFTEGAFLGVTPHKPFAPFLQDESQISLHSPLALQGRQYGVPAADVLNARLEDLKFSLEDSRALPDFSPPVTPSGTAAKKVVTFEEVKPFRRISVVDSDIRLSSSYNAASSMLQAAPLSEQLSTSLKEVRGCSSPFLPPPPAFRHRPHPPRSTSVPTARHLLAQLNAEDSACSSMVSLDRDNDGEFGQQSNQGSSPRLNSSDVFTFDDDFAANDDPEEEMFPSMPLIPCGSASNTSLVKSISLPKPSLKVSKEESVGSPKSVSSPKYVSYKSMLPKSRTLSDSAPQSPTKPQSPIKSVSLSKLKIAHFPHPTAATKPSLVSNSATSMDNVGNFKNPLTLNSSVSESCLKKPNLPPIEHIEVGPVGFFEFVPSLSNVLHSNFMRKMKGKPPKAKVNKLYNPHEKSSSGKLSSSDERDGSLPNSPVFLPSSPLASPTVAPRFTLFDDESEDQSSSVEETNVQELISLSDNLSA